MSHSPIPNSPDLPPPSDPSPLPNDPSRNRDEWIAVLVALLAMGGIFFWVFGKTDRPGGLLLGRRSSSTQVADTPSLSNLLQDPLSLESNLPSETATSLSPAPATSDSAGFQPNASTVARRRGLVLGGGTLFGGSQPGSTVTEAPSAEETTETPVEAEAPSDPETTDTPTDVETPVASPEATEEETTEEPTVAPTDETTTPEAEAEAETPEDTDEPAEAAAEQSQRPRFGIPIPGLGGKPDETETPAATDGETPTETAASPEATPEAEGTPTAEQPQASEDATETPTETAASPEATPEAEGTPTATATPTPDAEQADSEATPSTEEEATAAKPDKPGLGSLFGLGGQPSDTETAAEFSDVPDDFWAKDYVQYFVQRNIVTGYEDGSFKPEEPMSRAAVAAQIEEAFEFAETEQENATNFEDVGQEYWAQPAIQSTNQTGFLNGYPGEVFRPDQPMSRTEVLVALVSGLDLKPSGNPEEIVKVYQDADQIPAWAVEKVAAATEAGLVASYPNTATLNPNEPATRAEVSAMVYQALVQAGKADAKPSEYIINPKQ
jgi:hypothetical protein